MTDDTTRNPPAELSAPLRQHGHTPELPAPQKTTMSLDELERRVEAMSMWSNDDAAMPVVTLPEMVTKETETAPPNPFANTPVFPREHVQPHVTLDELPRTKAQDERRMRSQGMAARDARSLLGRHVDQKDITPDQAAALLPSISQLLGRIYTAYDELRHEHTSVAMAMIPGPFSLRSKVYGRSEQAVDAVSENMEFSVSFQSIRMRYNVQMQLHAPHEVMQYTIEPALKKAYMAEVNREHERIFSQIMAQIITTTLGPKDDHRRT